MGATPVQGGVNGGLIVKNGRRNRRAQVWAGIDGHLTTLRRRRRRRNPRRRSINPLYTLIREPSTPLSANTLTPPVAHSLIIEPRRHCVDQLADKFLMGPARVPSAQSVDWFNPSIVHQRLYSLDAVFSSTIEWSRNKRAIADPSLLNANETCRAFSARPTWVGSRSAQVKRVDCVEG